MADIVSYPGTGYYPPFVAGIINAAWNEGLDRANDLSNKVADITADGTGWLSTQAAPTIAGTTIDGTTIAGTEVGATTIAGTTIAATSVTAGTAEIGSIVEPDVDIPSSQSAGDVMSMFDSKYLELVALLSDKFVAFRTAYFPDEQTAYTAAENWLQAAIANPDSGLPPAVAAQILTDDKDRVLAEASRASEAVLAQFAARRFPLPPGAAAAAVLDVANKAQDEIAASGRKIVMASLEQMRWVIGQVMTLRQSAMDSAIKYITALASGPEMASRLVGIGYDAQSKLISSASQFYNSRIAAAEATAKVSQFNANLGLEAAAKNQIAALQAAEKNQTVAFEADAKNQTAALEAAVKNQAVTLEAAAKNQAVSFEAAVKNQAVALEAAAKNQTAQLALVEDRLKALLTECQAIAQMATALFNNVQASASVTASDSVSTSL